MCNHPAQRSTRSSRHCSAVPPTRNRILAHTVRLRRCGGGEIIKEPRCCSGRRSAGTSAKHQKARGPRPPNANAPNISGLLVASSASLPRPHNAASRAFLAWVPCLCYPPTSNKSPTPAKELTPFRTTSPSLALSSAPCLTRARTRPDVGAASLRPESSPTRSSPATTSRR